MSPQRKLAEVDGTLREVRRWWERSGRQTGPAHIGLGGPHMGFVPRSWILPNLHHIHTLVSDPHVCTCRGLGHFLMVCLQFSDFCASLLNVPTSVSDLPKATFSTAALPLTLQNLFQEKLPLTNFLLYSTPFSLLAFHISHKDAPVLNLIQQSSMDPTFPSSYCS